MSDVYGFSLRQLQYAVAVADLLSFRKAAETCHVSQPSLSAQIAELEAQLNVILFERSRKKVLTTGAGDILIERMRQVLHAASDLKQACRQVRDPLEGTMHLGVIPTIACYLLPDATGKLRKKFPNLRVAWREEKTEDLLEALRKGYIDGTLLALEADLGFGDIEYEEVAKDRFFLIVDPHHSLAKDESRIGMKQLRGEAVLLLDEGHCFRTQALEVCNSARAKELEFRATSLATLVQMVAQGMGVTLIPELAIASEARHTRLVVREFRDPVPNRTIVLVWRRNSPVASAMKEIAGVFRKSYQDIVLTKPLSGEKIYKKKK